MALFVLTAKMDRGAVSHECTYEVYARHESQARDFFYHFLRGKGWTSAEIRSAEIYLA